MNDFKTFGPTLAYFEDVGFSQVFHMKSIFIVKHFGTICAGLGTAWVEVVDWSFWEINLWFTPSHIGKPIHYFHLKQILPVSSLCDSEQALSLYLVSYVSFCSTFLFLQSPLFPLCPKRFFIWILNSGYAPAGTVDRFDSTSFDCKDLSVIFTL